MGVPCPVHTLLAFLAIHCCPMTLASVPHSLAYACSVSPLRPLVSTCVPQHQHNSGCMADQAGSRMGTVIKSYPTLCEGLDL